MVEVTVEGGDEVVRVDIDPSDSLLSGLLRAGVGVPYECSAGGCGSCKVQLTAGELGPTITDTPGLRASDIRRNKHLACSVTPVGDCAVAFRPDKSYRPSIVPKKFTARFESRRDLTHDLTEFTFVSEQTPSFIPGQYAKLTLPDGSLTRNYSMSNTPSPAGVWQFIIRRVADGALTPKLFELQPGEGLFGIDGPYSVAHFDAASPRAPICIAGGSGLAPMVSIIRGLQENPERASTAHLFYGARAVRDLFALDYLSGIAGFDPLAQVHSVLSDPDQRGDWTGPTGFIHEHLAGELPPDCASSDFYLAGPPVMVEAVRRLLILERGVPADQVRYDRFF